MPKFFSPGSAFHNIGISLVSFRGRGLLLFPVPKRHHTMPEHDFNDGPNPCPCPPEVIELLALGVRYCEASLGSSRPDAVLGAEYLKTFMEQPSTEWCRYISEGGRVVGCE